MDKSIPAPFNPYRNLTADIEDEIFAILIKGEVDFVLPEMYCDNEDSKNLRQYAVQYIEELHERNKNERSDALIPYTAITYFDRFCSGGDFPLVVGDTEIDLCLTCCLILAWKLRTKTFNLQQFLVDKNLTFTAECVLHMELQICKSLKWRIRALTPFTFVNYSEQFMFALQPGCPPKTTLYLGDRGPDHPSAILSVHQLILTSQCAIAFAKCRPSVVAAAALRLVAMKLFPFRYRRFESSIGASKLLNNQYLEMIVKCSEELKPLYIDRYPSSSCFDEIPIGKGIALIEIKYDVYPDEILNFELGWTEALKQLDTHGADIAADDTTQSCTEAS